MMTTTCQLCGSRQTGTSGVCPKCDGVALYDMAWGAMDSALSPATPLLQSTVPGLDGLLLKVEGTHSSGSFKERVMRRLVHEAVDSGARGAIVASSGNAAIAAATACARVRLPLLVLVPSGVSPSAVKMVTMRGAVVVRAGDGPAAVHGLAARLSDKFALPNLASTFRSAGCEWSCRGIGHELAVQVADHDIPAVAASISVGPVLVGTGNGLCEAGRPQPSLAAAQAAGCAPIAHAYAEGAEEVAPWEQPATTAALAIADRLTGYAHEATYALSCIRASGGFVEAVTDEEMRDMRRFLARHDGLDVELASCAAPAALHRRGFDRGTVCILTGAGVKETLTEHGHTDEPGTVEQFAHDAGSGDLLVQEVNAWVHAHP